MTKLATWTFSPALIATPEVAKELASIVLLLEPSLREDIEVDLFDDGSQERCGVTWAIDEPVADEVDDSVVSIHRFDLSELPTSDDMAKLHLSLVHWPQAA